MQTVQNALARAVTKTSKQHHVTTGLKSLHWLKVPQSIHYKIVSLTYNIILFKPLYPLTFANFSLSTSLIIIFRYPALQSHPIWSPATAPLPTLHQLFGTNSQKTSVSLLILLTLLLISPLLGLNSPLLIPLTTEDWTLYKISNLIFHSCATTRPPSSPIATTLSPPRLDVLGFWPGTETKRVAWLLWTWFGNSTGKQAVLSDVTFVDDEKFSEIYITLRDFAIQ